MKSLSLSVLVVYQIRENSQNDCHLKIQTTVTLYSMCTYIKGTCHICSKCEFFMFKPVAVRAVHRLQRHQQRTKYDFVRPFS